MQTLGSSFERFQTCAINPDGMSIGANLWSTGLIFIRNHNRLSCLIAKRLCILKRIYVKRSTNSYNSNWSRHANVVIAHQLCLSRRELVNSGWLLTIGSWTNKLSSPVGHYLLSHKFFTLWRETATSPLSTCLGDSISYLWKKVVKILLLSVRRLVLLSSLLCRWVSRAVRLSSSHWWKEL